MRLWSRNIIGLLDKLKDTIPGDGMTGEVHYWRDMARILEALTAEIKQPYVEICLQALASKDPMYADTVKEFSQHKNRVLKGVKEARWNNKYMKVIEKPVAQVEEAKELKEIMFVVASLMKTLKNIYENSNFYKEARIVSFIDRLHECIIAKIKQHININVAILQGQ